MCCMARIKFSGALRPTLAAAQGTQLVARTVKTLRAGDPVERCYGPQQGNTVTAERRRKLQAKYNFHCR